MNCLILGFFVCLYELPTQSCLPKKGIYGEKIQIKGKCNLMKLVQTLLLASRFFYTSNISPIDRSSLNRGETPAMHAADTGETNQEGNSLCAQGS